MQNRRTFLKQTLATPVAAIPAPARRKRRIIWNNDGDDLRFMAFGIKRLWTADDPEAIPLPDHFSSVQEFLDLRMSALAGTQVDSLFYCAHFNWSVWDFPREHISVLGPDPLIPVVEAAHKNGMEFFFSVRMNDCHSSLTHHGPAWWEPFRLQNPQLLQANLTKAEFDKRILPWARGESDVHPLADVFKRRGGASRDYQCWSAYDYAHPEVPAYFLSVIEEACRRYDLEGVELDFLRHPFFFRFGQERRSIPIMSDFVRQIRRALDTRARQRGRPILLAVRVPDTPESALAIGLDPEAWLADRSVDLLIAGNGNAPFSAPFRRWVEAGHARNVPVYGSLDRMERFLGKPEAMRAAALRAWKHGVDGIYFFNHFIPAEYGTLREVGDSERIARMNKLYRIDPDYSRKQNNTIAPGQLPLQFAFGAGPASTTLRIELADRLESNSRTTLLTQWNRQLDAQRIAWTVNGQPLTGVMQVRDESRNWQVYPCRGLREGMNQIEVRLQPASAANSPALSLEQVRIAIEHT